LQITGDADIGALSMKRNECFDETRTAYGRSGNEDFSAGMDKPSEADRTCRNGRRHRSRFQSDENCQMGWYHNYNSGIVCFPLQRLPLCPAQGVAPGRQVRIRGTRTHIEPDPGDLRRVRFSEPAHRRARTGVIQIEAEETREFARRSAREKGLLVGISSGSTLAEGGRCSSTRSARRVCSLKRTYSG